jgi:hypothetical protein
VPQVIPWLLDGDPAIRWQTLRDLAGASEATVERERRRVARDGWGARLLARQDPEGTWAGGRSSDGGLYSPKWTSTTYTMLLLRDFGLPAGNRQARKACKLLLDGGLQRDGGINFGIWAKWTRRGETCVTGMVLSILAHFEYDDDRLDTLAEHLLEQQMPDGGWNCQRPSGATHSSVHTTISVLEGLRLYELHQGRHLRAVREAQRRGREFSWCIGCFAPTGLGKSSSRSSPASLSRPDGITISSARSTISRPLMRHVIRDLRMPSPSCRTPSFRTAAGRCKTRTRAKRISSSNASGRRAAGIRCGHCEC